MIRLLKSLFCVHAYEYTDVVECRKCGHQPKHIAYVLPTEPKRLSVSDLSDQDLAKLGLKRI